MPSLKIDVATDVADVEAKFAAAGTAVTGFGTDVEAASRKADASTSRIDAAADATDNMASKSSQAAGGLGDLGGALALMPGPLGAMGAGMEAAAAPVMGLVGAADLANLALSSNVVTTGKAKVAAAAHTTVTKAQTIAQKALNIAMKANPIGLLIAAVLLLVGGLVLAYKKSETFRAIVQKVMGAARTAVGWVVDKLSDLVGWLGDKLGPWWTRTKDAAVNAFKAIIGPVQAVIDKVKDVVGWVGDAIDATRRAIGLGREYESTMGSIIGNVLDGLADVGAALGDQARGGRGSVGGASGGGVGNPRTVAPVINVRVDGLVTDPIGTGRAIRKALADYDVLFPAVAS